MPFYAVAKGRSTGIYHSWAECEAQVKGFPGAEYKKFKTLSSANAFMRSNSESGYSADSESSANEIDVLDKQIDYIKKRLKGFSNGVDKITTCSSRGSQSQGRRKTSTLVKPPQPKRCRYNEGYVNVYTVGTCWLNGEQGAQAGFGVFWGDNHPLNCSKPVSGRVPDNRGQIQAVMHAIKTALKHGITKLAINTNSEALINAATKLMPEWKRRGWKRLCGEPVKYEVDFKELDSLQDQLQLKWNYVEAYNGNHGIEMANRLAQDGADMYT